MVVEKVDVVQKKVRCPVALEMVKVMELALARRFLGCQTPLNSVSSLLVLNSLHLPGHRMPLT